jgi:hypothetical protein
VRALVAGWFSFEGMGATAGDLIARDVVCAWLTQGGLAFDVATAPPFDDGIDWRSAAADYSHVVFVCGPFGNGEPVASFIERFSTSRLVGVDLTMLQSLGEWDPFDLLIERDSDRRSHPDLVFAADVERVPIVGLTLIHAQPEYGVRDLHLAANDALIRLVARHDAAVVPIDTRLDEVNQGGLRSPAQIASMFGAMNLVLTTRLHGMVLALAAGVPALVVDPVQGGAKVSAQAETIAWPVVFRSGQLVERELDSAFRFCLTAEARDLAATVRVRARERLEAARLEFLGFVGRGDASGPVQRSRPTAMRSVKPSGGTA